MSFLTKSLDYYRKKANPECKVCDGLGVEDYHVDQDWKEIAPCELCFPDDPGTKKAKEWWRKSGETDRLRRASLEKRYF